MSKSQHLKGLADNYGDNDYDDINNNNDNIDIHTNTHTHDLQNFSLSNSVRFAGGWEGVTLSNVHIFAKYLSETQN